MLWKQKRFTVLFRFLRPTEYVLEAAAAFFALSVPCTIKMTANKTWGMRDDLIAQSVKAKNQARVAIKKCRSCL